MVQTGSHVIQAHYAEGGWGQGLGQTGNVNRECGRL